MDGGRPGCGFPRVTFPFQSSKMFSSKVTGVTLSLLFGAGVALFVALVIPRKHAAIPTAIRTPEEGLMKWVIDNGGQVIFTSYSKTGFLTTPRSIFNPK